VSQTPNEPPLVEVPLDWSYITEEGAYVAGYNWGRKGRSPNDPQVKNCGISSFILGVKDGYGDWKAQSQREIERDRRNVEREERRKWMEAQKEVQKETWKETWKCAVVGHQWTTTDDYRHCAVCGQSQHFYRPNPKACNCKQCESIAYRSVYAKKRKPAGGN
jgi:hypothetical protein